jgi:hypothetical protein
MQATHDAVTEGLFATQQVISDVFFDALTGKMKSFKEYMLTFLKDLSSALSDFAAKMAMMGIIKGAVGAATSLFGGGGGLIPVGGGGWGGPAATGGGGLIPVSGGSASFGSLLNPSVTPYRMAVRFPLNSQMVVLPVLRSISRSITIFQ